MEERSFGHASAPASQQPEATRIETMQCTIGMEITRQNTGSVGWKIEDYSSFLQGIHTLLIVAIKPTGRRADGWSSPFPSRSNSHSVVHGTMFPPLVQISLILQ